MRKSTAFSAIVLLVAGTCYWMQSGGVSGLSGQSLPIGSTNVEEGRGGLPQRSGHQPPALEREASLSTLLAQVMPLAQGGDPEAAEIVAGVLKYCSHVRNHPGGFDAMIEFSRRHVPDGDIHFEPAANRARKRCEGVREGEEITIEEIEDWLSKAAVEANASAVIQLAIREEVVAPEAGPVLMNAVISGGDPNEIRDAGVMLYFMQGAGHQGLTRFANDAYGKLAWEVAACRRGASCRAGSVFMDRYCFGGSRCGHYATFEDMVRMTRIPPGSIADFERLVTAADDYMAGRGDRQR